MKLLTAFLSLSLSAFAQTPLPRVDHSPWDSLLKEFVNEQHRVDYQRLKQEESETLADYVAALGAAGSEPLAPQERTALLINAYNAMAIHWILENYPTPSIWDTPNPFQGRHHLLGGARISLDEIESRLRETGDPRIHSALVCAARSCPPLRREAYVAERVEEQLDANTREWLANPSLNQFYPQRGEAEVSAIFKWYAEDFESYPGGLEGFLRKYAPATVAETLPDRELAIRFRDYEWGLNDTSEIGKDYSMFQLALDWLQSWFLNWFYSLGPKYGVNPLLFGGIYVGAIPFFTFSVAWIVRNLRRKQSVLLPAFSASFCFVSAYLYLLIVGRNIPAWVYFFIAGMVGLGIHSTFKKIRQKLETDGKQPQE